MNQATHMGNFGAIAGASLAFQPEQTKMDAPVADELRSLARRCADLDEYLSQLESKLIPLLSQNETAMAPRVQREVRGSSPIVCSMRETGMHLDALITRVCIMRDKLEV
jgi:hypothetical protein